MFKFILSAMVAMSFSVAAADHSKDHKPAAGQPAADGTMPPATETTTMEKTETKAKGPHGKKKTMTKTEKKEEHKAE